MYIDKNKKPYNWGNLGCIVRDQHEENISTKNHKFWKFSVVVLKWSLKWGGSMNRWMYLL